MSTPGSDLRSVTRTYRTAIRLGEDFITLEETISLPLGASDEEVQQAVELGWRIYQAQRAALEAQVASVRESQPAPAPIVVRDPDAPASDKQRHYIATLQEQLAWSNEQLGVYANEHTVDLVTMTKGQASSFIDGLKRLAEERTRYHTERRAQAVAEDEPPIPAQPTVDSLPASERPARSAEQPAADSPPASERQIQALKRLAQSLNLSLEAESERRFGVTVSQLSDEQARILLSEWQARPARPPRG